MSRLCQAGKQPLASSLGSGVTTRTGVPVAAGRISG